MDVERQRAADPRITLLKDLADPIRLRVIDRLTNQGPATVTQLADELQVALPQLSNHLRRLRAAKLVNGTRHGRQVVYALSDPGLELLPPLLDSIAGRVHGPAQPIESETPSRTCYQHLGGAIGVGIYQALRDRKALVARPDGVVAVGPEANDVFACLGIDPGRIDARRQRFAFECLDATQRRPHLAGALGDALAQSLTEHSWIDRAADGRDYVLTPGGEDALRAMLGYPPAPDHQDCALHLTTKTARGRSAPRAGN